MNINLLIAISLLSVNAYLATKASISDYQSRTISNQICKLLFIVNLLGALYFSYFLDALFSTGICFIVLIGLWLLNVIGAGDIKLLCAFSVGIEPSLITFYLVSIGLLGGAQVLIMGLVSLLSGKNRFKMGIPYGIPISISGIVFVMLSFLAA
ncbi:peptidase [Vibrio sp. JPW-9-11-11]|uniref:prepilin peptidase n=1 Tax=Vibrio sp. JPW-9-11-11 TaxID=1416532 RepID=UPI0015935761|nr:prepilin peptidase [Vibrio sp. JPW-9-11-11]NVD07818.1 peptidase [Vibrio sp. JPW-9-11-11]